MFNTYSYGLALIARNTVAHLDEEQDPTGMWGMLTIEKIFGNALEAVASDLNEIPDTFVNPCLDDLIQEHRQARKHLKLLQRLMNLVGIHDVMPNYVKAQQRVAAVSHILATI